MKRVNKVLKKIGQVMDHLWLAIVSVAVLLAIGLTLLEVQGALKAPVDQVKLEEGRAFQAFNKFKFDDDIRQDIVERGEGLSPQQPVGNPFEY